MIAAFKPCRLSGSIDAPPSKSMAHRYLIGAALCGETCRLSGFDYFDFPTVYSRVEKHEIQEFLRRVVHPDRCCLSLINPIKEVM